MKTYNIHNTLFNIFIIISYFLLALNLSGYKNANVYLQNIDYYVKIYISLFLLYRFNPFRSIVFNELDRKIVFTSGLMLLTTTTINQIIINYMSKYFKFS